jgi:TctA family transporter
MQPAPLLLGFVLGPMMEDNLRRTMIISRGEFSVFLHRPIAAAFILLTLALLAWALWNAIPHRSRRPSVGEPA